MKYHGGKRETKSPLSKQGCLNKMGLSCARDAISLQRVRSGIYKILTSINSYCCCLSCLHFASEKYLFPSHTASHLWHRKASFQSTTAQEEVPYQSHIELHCHWHYYQPCRALQVIWLFYSWTILRNICELWILITFPLFRPFLQPLPVCVCGYSAVHIALCNYTGTTRYWIIHIK